MIPEKSLDFLEVFAGAVSFGGWVVLRQAVLDSAYIGRRAHALFCCPGIGPSGARTGCNVSASLDMEHLAKQLNTFCPCVCLRSNILENLTS